MSPARASRVWAASLVVVALATNACNSGDEATGADRRLILPGCEPQAPLVPSLALEECGATPLGMMFSGLYGYVSTSTAPMPLVADSVEVDEDNTEYRFVLEQGWTFHDGSPVTAASFVDAWNWGAYGPNAAYGGYFFEPIEGYADVAGEDSDGDGQISEQEVTADAMSGLVVVSDLEFTVRLSSPQATFVDRLGMIGFAPLPESFFDDPEAFAEEPIGNGPMRFVERDPEVSMRLERYEEYAGPATEVEGVEFRAYRSPDAAYADLVSNNVDVLTSLPTSALTDGVYRQDLDDRWREYPIGSVSVLLMPQYLPGYSDPRLGRALSLGIDREQVIDVGFAGQREAADGWVSPIVAGYAPGACGSWCDLDPERGKALLAEVGFTGPVILTYAATTNTKDAVEALCVSITNTLSLPCEPQPVPDFSTLLDMMIERELPGPAISNWSMDYPSIENFLSPTYVTDAPANDSAYSSETFDALIAEAATLAGEASTSKYQDAESLLADDMPSIPLWYGRFVAAWSERIETVGTTPTGSVDLGSVRFT